MKTKQLEINRTIWVTGILAATIDIRPCEWRWTLKCFHIWTDPVNTPLDLAATCKRCATHTHSLLHTHTHTHTLSLSYTHTHTLSLTHTHTHTLSLSYTHTHTHTHTLSLSHTHTHSLSLSHTHTHSLLHTHTHSLSLSLLHMHTHTCTQQSKTQRNRTHNSKVFCFVLSKPCASEQYSWSKQVTNLMLYAQSTSTVMSGPYTFCPHTIDSWSIYWTYSCCILLQNYFVASKIMCGTKSEKDREDTRKRDGHWERSERQKGKGGQGGHD